MCVEIGLIEKSCVFLLSFELHFVILRNDKLFEQMDEKFRFSEEIKDLAQMAKVMGHPVRLYILQKLAKMNACCYSGDLVDELPIGRSTLSQHLKELKYAGLIQGELEAPFIKYCLNRETWERARYLFNDLFDQNKKLTLIKMKILILCTGNSCRSQMAEGYLKALDERLTVFSAGTNPSTSVHPKAVKVMAEDGIDISGHTPAPVENYLDQTFDYVITVCDGAKESCPVFTGKVHHRLHIGFEDPAEVTGTDDFVLSEFRRIRDEIKRDFTAFYIEKLKPTL